MYRYLYPTGPRQVSALKNSCTENLLPNHRPKLRLGDYRRAERRGLLVLPRLSHRPAVVQNVAGDEVRGLPGNRAGAPTTVLRRDRLDLITIERREDACRDKDFACQAIGRARRERRRAVRRRPATVRVVPVARSPAQEPARCPR